MWPICKQQVSQWYWSRTSAVPLLKNCTWKSTVCTCNLLGKAIDIQRRLTRCTKSWSTTQVHIYIYINIYTVQVWQVSWHFAGQLCSRNKPSFWGQEQRKPFADLNIKIEYRIKTKGLYLSSRFMNYWWIPKHAHAVKEPSWTQIRWWGLFWCKYSKETVAREMTSII